MQTGDKESGDLSVHSRGFWRNHLLRHRRLEGSAKVVQRSRFNLIREAQIWVSRSPEQRPISIELENVVVLSDDFYQEILDHPVPNDLGG